MTSFPLAFLTAHRRRAVIMLIAVVALAGTLFTSGSANAYGRDDGDVQTAAAAIPAQSGDVARADAHRVERPFGRDIRGSAVATSSTTCDGCQARAVTLQVIYARHVRSIAVDNVAAAWSSCSSCTGTALALQVVIARRADDVRAANRSLALNVTCVDCRTAAAAVQIVAVSPDQRELSPAAVASIEQLRDELAAQLDAEVGRSAVPTGLASAPAARAAAGQASARAALDALSARVQAIVAGDLHASTVRHLDLHAG